jgi:hypothetical protein
MGTNKTVNAYVAGTGKSQNAYDPNGRKTRSGAAYQTWDDSYPHTWDDSYPNSWDDYQKPSFTTGGVNKTRNSTP